MNSIIILPRDNNYPPPPPTGNDLYLEGKYHMSPLFDDTCVDKTGGYANRVMPPAAAGAAYVWGTCYKTCAEVPAEILAVGLTLGRIRIIITPSHHAIHHEGF